MNDYLLSTLLLVYIMGFIYIVIVTNITNDTFVRYPNNSRWFMRSIMALLWPCMVIQEILFIIIDVLLDPHGEMEDEL